jgi:16S rRNA (cytidine1402-2'-O)-methyltransferase
MPSPSHTDKGVLYVVASPLGNMDDITLRAIKILKKVKLVAAEDTRCTARLFSYHNIKTPLISCHEHNEDKRAENLIKKLEEGAEIALITDAGTPLISDPGYLLVNKAILNNIKVVPIPGASATTTALSASGLPTDSFLFTGFLPKKSKKRAAALKRLSEYKETLIFFESPYRIIQLIDDMITIMGDREASLAREITKPYEEFIRGKLTYIKEELEKRDRVKGECTLIVSGFASNFASNFASGKKDAENSYADKKNEIIEDIKRNLEKNELKLSAIAKKLAKKYSLKRQVVYDYILEIKRHK